MPRRWDKWITDPDPVIVAGTPPGVLFHNNRYHVILRITRNLVEGLPDVIHLSIRNNDRSANHDWRDFQRIKDEIVGEDIEMVELYPRHAHITDTSNQFHLWGLKTTEPPFYALGLGWEPGQLIWDGKGPHPFPERLQPDVIQNAVQRPMEK